MGNVPKMRFSEFSDSWKQSSLRELTKINQGLQIPIADRLLEQVADSFFYITNEFLKAGSAKKYFIKSPPESVICNEKDVLMTRTGNTGQVVTDVAGAFHNNFFKIKYTDEVDKSFLVSFLRLPKTQRIIMNYAGASTIPDLNHGDFYRITIDLPTLQEQQKIAAFLTAVDTKIEQLTQKEALLKQYKKGVMQKIFSQEIRFKADDGSEFPEWVCLPMSHLGKTFNGLTGKTAEDFGEGQPYIQYKQIFDSSKIDLTKAGLVKIVSGERQQVAKYGDVFFTTSSETPNEVAYASVLLDEVDNLYLNSFCFGYRVNSLEEFLPPFARYYFRSEGFRREAIKLAQGSTRYNISKTEMMKTTIQLPSIDEQRKIALCLSAFDDKLSQVSGQIEAAKTFKKGLLQQMFV